MSSHRLEQVTPEYKSAALLLVLEPACLIHKTEDGNVLHREWVNQPNTAYNKGETKNKGKVQGNPKKRTLDPVHALSCLICVDKKKFNTTVPSIAFFLLSLVYMKKLFLRDLDWNLLLNIF
jgi:hypothetical protein